MGDVLAALAWLFGALGLVALLVWGSLRGAVRAARLRRQGREDREEDDRR